MLRQYSRAIFEQEAVDDEGLSALHWAAVHDSVPVAKLLLEAKADVHKQTTKHKYHLCEVFSSDYLPLCN